jgi:acyl transferase domain-containing protein/NAD(P)H-dependent flavin oxidoreductase YrpB (nitropropane dioxygenase family)/acyl carrier protein
VTASRVLSAPPSPSPVRSALAPSSNLRDLVIGVSPFGEPNARLVASVCRAGGLGVLDLGAGDHHAREALGATDRMACGPFGVRVAAGCALTPGDLPAQVDTVLLGADLTWQPTELAQRHRVLVEVTGVEEARRAARRGAHGLVARGHEAGGRVGELGSFVLLQRLLCEEELSLPVWVWGGIGLRVAAAAVVGGAAGIVLDSQLALLAESDLPDEVRTLVATMDGSETVVLGGHRVHRRGRAAPQAAADPTEASTAPRLGARDLATQLLPIGQDGFLAKRFADRFRTAGGVVRGMRAAIVASLRDDSVADTLRAGSPLAQALRTRLPIAQGPMTRVSDRARFGAAVAEHGAMPFIALALADREQTLTLLREARAALGDRPWGVGVLGFAPDETRAAQLEVIRELRPSCAVIAGGRPAQAAALEEAGIAAFLHVPSPGLLRQFLDAGARKFVFEGSECGGHVGPRSSFALWEAQLGVLAEFLDARRDDAAAGEIQVLFAGGIHDARSAAMVAVLAAPLTRRGASVGVLMGTAYLFTEEAVACDAIQALFQRELRQADRTELLETAPGHVTRCLASPFASSFRAIKSDLRARAVPDRQMWEELERLNLGRLRIASKGVRRVSADLVAVDEAQQLVEGLFMAGQVAVLRSQTTTIAGLHAAVSDGAADFLGARTTQLRRHLGVARVEVVAPPAPPPLDVAIVGMACVFPGSCDLAGFWANVVAGVDLITEVPAERWDPDVYYSPEAAADRTPSRWGGFLPRVPFDALRYGIPPSSLPSIEPVQLLALETARRALADAGYGERDFDRSRTAVVFGAEAGSDLSNAAVLRTLLPGYLGAVPEELADQLPRLTEDSFAGMLSNVIAGRIANRLDLGGASYTVDAACASSLAALDMACKELAGGASDLVLCGGADLHNGIHDYLLFASVGALSPSGRCRAFDGSADGIVLGEGVACVALKRLADAERDGDRIYAVIEGVGSASDGRSVGVTAPRPEGQRSALERAYRNARISVAEVGLVEAHGTATAVGDHTELTTLTTMFAEAGAAPGSCALGSVKSQIGHTKCAAGLAGLIKAVLAVHAGVRPPTLHLEEPNAVWQARSSPFAFFREARPWAAPPAERVAGVSAFGFGGTNFHAVVRGHDATQTPRHGLDEWPAELFTFRGADHGDARRSIEQLLELIGTNDAHGRPWRLRDLARTTSRRSDQHGERVQVAIVATDLDDLTDLLRRALLAEGDPGRGLFVADGCDRAGKLAVLFAGQGSQRPGMLAELFVAFPEVQQYLQLGRQWAGALFPAAAFDADDARGQEARLRDTRFAQPALGIAGLAVNHLLGRLDVRPEMLAGHSYGELVALCCAGAFDAATLLRLSAARAEAVLAAAADDPGTMAAVSASAAEVERALRAARLDERVVVANHNAPRQVVISGPTAAVERAVEQLRAAGHASRPIPVACAFHSPLVAGACSPFARVLAGQSVYDLELPVWSNRTADRYPAGADDVRAGLAAQIGAPVRFVEQIEAMYADGARVFFEAGPGTVLTGAVAAILGDRPHVAVGCEGPAGRGLPGFLAAVAQLAVAGVRLRTGWLFGGRDATDVSTATPPAPSGWTVDGQMVRTVDGACLPGGLAPARRVAGLATTGGGGDGDGERREELVGEFLRTSREIVAAQRDVLLRYFGPAHPAAVAAAPAFASPGAAVPAAAAPAAADTPARPPGAEIPATAVAAPPEGTTDVLHEVLAIISERTGYPIDMIEPDLDLEADLSIDSIKRTEIVGELAIRLGIATDVAALSDADLREPAQARTAGAIAQWLASKDGPSPAPVAQTGAPDDRQAAAEPVPHGDPAKRFVLRSRPLDDEAADSSVLAGARFVVFGGGRVGAELAALLSGHGVAVSVVEQARPLTDSDDPVDGVVVLDALAPADRPLLPDAFPTFQAALARGPRWLLAASPLDASNGRPSPRRGQVAGLRGLFRTVARECPNVHAALVEVDAAGSPAATARLLVGELLAADRSALVRHVDGARHALHMVETPLGAGDGAEAPANGAAAAAALGLNGDSVVLLVGGARGITAHLATALAAASGCRLELVGRTPLPVEPEHALIAAAGDRPALRAALVALGHRSTTDVERAVSRILAQREIQATIGELRALGSSVRYHALDAVDRERMRLVVEQIESEHGRLDGAVYAAGVIDDRLLLDKDQESFRRVFNTKVEGAAALLDAVEALPDSPRFVVLFGSIAAVVGNRGQADYAAANDALESLGASWAARTGRRALTVHWGPWAPNGRHGGMVTPELQVEYGRRGIALIDPREGPLCLLRELAWGEPSERAVVYAASAW